MSGRLTFRQLHSTLFLVLLFLFLVSPSTSDELQILLNFKSSLNNTKSTVFSSWTPENPPCKFTGIVCNDNGFVKEINLSQQQLDGVVPFDSICGLQSLERISLGSNFLRGVISGELRNCRKLTELDLGKNSFAGEIPDLSSLHELKLVSLNMSGFSGSFPWNSLNNLTNLEFLSLGDNPFDPTDSFPVELLKLEKLKWLYLSNCSLRGEIPDGISNLILLENFELSDNRISGEIPRGIGKLSKLWQFEIYNNSLTGRIPEEFGNLTSLVNFDASTNQLEGDIMVLRSLKKLSSLQLFENNFSGEIPEEFGDLKYLTGLSLYKNKFTGKLPQKIGSWGDLSFIDVSENFLTGPIPPDMCKNGKMTDLLILQNNFTGEIPEAYSNCKSLIRLRINNNSLSGSVPPGIWGLPDLIVADLSMNQFKGPLTSDIGNARSLGLLILTENLFSGELPEEISNASSLVSIQLSSNQFSGQIPESIGQLKRLSSLYIDENRLSGTLPVSIGSCSSLTVLNLSGNFISGEIPESLGHLSSLNSLILSNNNLSGEIPVSLSSLRLSNLDFSNNHLVGPIPEALSLRVFRDGYEGNPGLCSYYLINFRTCSTKIKNSSHLRVLLSCFAAGLLVLVISAVYLLVTKSRMNNQNREKPLKGGSWDMKSFRMLSFSEKEVIDAIQSKNLIGKGGSGNVYKVSLGNGSELAVKHIWTSSPNDRKTCHSSSAILVKRNIRSVEFDAEVAALSAVRHMNVVKLYCSITSEDSSLLVYEYLPNGSLWDQLHSCNKMGWELRYAIAVGAAKGLEYLHHGFDKPVIHRDVKSSNILLDEEWRPRIADFGLAKIVHSGGGGDWSHFIAGTHGYMPPEYGYTCKVTEKSDVYSFGVVLMELVTGKRPFEPEFGENKDIVHWVCSKITSKESALDIVDPIISENLKEDAIQVLRIAVHCTARLPVLRPTMRMVVNMLEDAEPLKLSDIVVVKKDDESCAGKTLKG